MDSIDNRFHMRRLIDRDTGLQEEFRKSGSFEDADQAFQAAHELARDGQALMGDMYLQLERLAPEGKPVFAQDIIQGIAARNRGEELPVTVKARLEQEGMIDPATGGVKASAEGIVHDRFSIGVISLAKHLGASPFKVGEGDVQLFGVADPLAIFSGFRGFEVDGERQTSLGRITKWLIRSRPMQKVLGPSVSVFPWFENERVGFVDYLQESYRQGHPDQHWGAKTVRSMARAINLTVGRVEQIMSPEKSGSTLSREKSQEYRRLTESQRAVMMDVRLKADVLSRDMFAELTGEEGRIAGLALASFEHDAPWLRLKQRQ